MIDNPTNGKHDAVTHRILVAMIGTSALLTVAGITALEWVGRTAPHSLSIALGTALGSLATMLAAIMRQPSYPPEPPRNPCPPPLSPPSPASLASSAPPSRTPS